LSIGVDSDDEIPPTAKRRRTALIDSDSESENESPNKRKSPKRVDPPAKRSKIKPQASSDEDDSDAETSDVEKVDSQKSLIESFGYSKSEEAVDVTNGNDGLFDKKAKKKSGEDGDLDSGWLHETLEFLKPSKIRDAHKR